MNVAGKIFRCQPCCREIRVDYEGGVQPLMLTEQKVQAQWAYTAEFGQPNMESPQLGSYLYDVGWCSACMEKLSPDAEIRVDRATKLYEQLWDNHQRTIEDIEFRAPPVLKQVALDLTLADVQRAIGHSVDLTFGDRYATAGKRLKLIKTFVQKYSSTMEELIRKRFYAEGSIPQTVKYYRQDALPRKRELKALLSLVYFQKKTNAAEQLNDNYPNFDSVRQPTQAAPDEMFYGDPGLNVPGITHSLDISNNDCGLHKILNKKMMHEIIDRLTLQVVPVDQVDSTSLQ